MNIGDVVEFVGKDSYYKGKVVAVFCKLNGVSIRCVVEDDRGLLLIKNPNQAKIVNDKSYFHQELQNEIPKSNSLLPFVKEYHDRCDAYDKERCPPNGIPRTNEGLAAINRNARATLMEIATRMCMEGLGSSIYACELLLREALHVIPYKPNRDNKNC